MQTPQARNKHTAPLDPGGQATTEEVREALADLFAPRLIVCIAGSYSDGSEHCLDVEAARQVLQLTRTNACVMQFPTSAEHIPEQALPITDLLKSFVDRGRLVPLLNTSRATHAKQALEMIDAGLESFSHLRRLFPHPPILKLEILTALLEAIDDEVLRCLDRLPFELRQRTLPILSPSAQAVARAIFLGCPAVRLLVGRIGRATGILDPAAVARAIAAAQGRPVILEGGIDTPAQIQECAQLGASAVLLNSTFRLAPDPAARARELREAADRAWPAAKEGSCSQSMESPRISAG